MQFCLYDNLSWVYPAKGLKAFLMFWNNENGVVLTFDAEGKTKAKGANVFKGGCTPPCLYHHVNIRWTSAHCNPKLGWAFADADVGWPGLQLVFQFLKVLEEVEKQFPQRNTQWSFLGLESTCKKSSTEVEVDRADWIKVGLRVVKKKTHTK